jgi:hypothetical protein
MVVNLCGRGDKDLSTIAKFLEDGESGDCGEQTFSKRANTDRNAH